MNVIVEKRLAELSNRPRSIWMSIKRELRAVPEAMRWLLGIDK